MGIVIDVYRANCGCFFCIEKSRWLIEIFVKSYNEKKGERRVSITVENELQIETILKRMEGL